MHNPRQLLRAIGSGLAATLLSFTLLAVAAMPARAAETTLEVVHAMAARDGKGIDGPLVAGADGLYYGTATTGGKHDRGTLFRLRADGQFEVLHDFRGAPDDGDRPRGLVRGADGALYGLTLAGGAFDDGAAYRFDAQGKVKLLHSFDSAVDGRNPEGRLLQASDGRFYGATRHGGADDVGTIFRMRANGQVQSLHSFRLQGEDGLYPTGSLVEGADGLLYGTTDRGGPQGNGTIYKMRRHSGDVHILHGFGRKDRNGTALKALTAGPDGRFYGVIEADQQDNPRGLVYRIDARGHYEVFHSFTPPVDVNGKNPFQELLLGRDGAFYGTTNSGGANGWGGTIFRLGLDGVLSTLHSFGLDSPEGWFAATPLLEVADGEFLGATAIGAAGDQGAVYRLRVAP